MNRQVVNVSIPISVFFRQYLDGLMLPWYIGLTLFQHTTHLSSFHKVFQILNHILKKCLQTRMLLRYIHYAKSPFQNNLIQALQSNLLSVHKFIKMFEKVKIQSYCKTFTKILFDCICTMILTQHEHFVVTLLKTDQVT